MPKSNAVIVVSVAAGLLATATLMSRAGDLNPPPGPVAPTMHSLNEIYSAIQLLQGGGGGGGGCGPGAPGAPRLEASISFSSLPGQGPDPTPSTIYNAQQICNVQLSSSGLPTGTPVANVMMITKDIDASSPRLIEGVMTQVTIPDATITFHGASGASYYTIRLTNVRVASVQLEAAPLCGGAAHVERIVLAHQGLTWTHLATGVTFTTIP